MSASPDHLDRVRRNWERFGETDPLWSILVRPEHEEGRWDPDEFFASGRGDVARLLDECAAAGVAVPRGRCLDFGCGVGRLTQALCEHFESCDGVDIAGSMIALAERYNRHGARCRYHVNVADDLRLFDDETFDGIVSVIVLQHIPPPFNARYIAEFVRVLRPGGVAVFQLPAAHHPERLNEPPPVLTPLPAGAHRARLQLVGSIAALRPGETQVLSVRVDNDSAVRWSAETLLRLGNHWVSRFGRRRVQDDGRTEVPSGLVPGDSVVLPLKVTAPGWAGRCTVEIDLVEEGVCWFADRGSPTLRIPATIHGSRLADVVQRARRRVAPQRQAGKPEMEMHCVPVDDVVRIVEQAGGRVVQVQDWPVCGPAWDSMRYIVTR